MSYLSRRRALRGSLVALLGLLGLALSAPTANATALPTTISTNTTLTAAGSPYTGSTVTVSSGVTLTVQPGAVVKVARLNVNGTLNAQGTSSNRITFTSSAASPSAGDWKGIKLLTGSGASVVDYVDVLWAGGAVTSSSTDSAIEINNGVSPTVSNATISKSAEHGIYVAAGGSPSIHHNIVDDSAQIGIRYNTSAGGNVDIHDNVVSDSGANGIDVSASDTTTSTAFSGNTVSGSGGRAISYARISSHTPALPPDLADNVMTDNGQNAIFLAGDVEADATWGGARFVIMGAGVRVLAGKTLTLEPGTVVKALGVVEFDVTGTLDAVGTETDPIIFTSIKDDQTGPDPEHPDDTNGDGNATTPAVGSWEGIDFNSGSNASVLDEAEVRWAGYDSSGAQAAVEFWSGASPTISDTVVLTSGEYGIYARSGGSPVLNGNTVIGSADTAIYYSTTAGGAVSMSDNIVSEAGDGGILVEASSTTTPNAFSGNIVLNSAGRAISYTRTGSQTPPLPSDLSDNIVSGNAENGIFLSGSIAADATWGGGPFVMMGGGVNVLTGKTLTLQPGTVLKAIGVELDVAGTLNAQGTEANPIILTTIKDDDVGGDTNGDDNATSPAPGSWEGIDFASGSSASVLDEAEVRWAGSDSSSVDAAIQLLTGGPSPTISNTLVYESGDYGIYATTGGSPSIHNNLVIGSARSSIRYSASAGGNVNIHDNIVSDGADTGIEVSASATTTSSDFSGNIVLDGADRAISYLGGTSAPLPTDISDNIVSGNDLNGIYLSGRVTGSSTWGGATFVLITGSVTVDAAVTLTLEPDTVVKSEFGPLTVLGTLDAVGTESEKITFTTIKDNAVGGDSDVGTSMPEAGDWTGIKVQSAGNLQLDQANVRYAVDGVSISCPCTGSQAITNTKINLTEEAGITMNSFSAVTLPTVEWNTFRSNGTYAIKKSSTPKLEAPHNDFGSPSGPAPKGKGEEITKDTVDADPWVSGAHESADDAQGHDDFGKEDGDPVSLPTGALTYSHTDLALTTPGSPLAFTRTYNSSDDHDYGLGPGWAHTGLATAEPQRNGDVLIRRSDGRGDLFTLLSGGSYQSPRGISDRLEAGTPSGYLELTSLDRSVTTFDGTGRVTAITDDHGLVTDYDYDTNGRLAAVARSSGQSLTFSYDASNRITEVADSAGREVAYAYTAAGDLDTVTDALGGVTDYGYDSQHRLLTIKDPRGVTFLTNTYDAQDRVIEQRDGLNNLWTLDYDSGETTVTQPEGGQRTYAFDAHQRVTSMTNELGHTTAYSYDSAGNIEEVTAPGGAVTSLDYDAAGNLLSSTDPEGGETIYTYDSQNRATSMTDPRGKVWSYTWDSANDLTDIDGPGAADSSIDYNTAGQPTEITDPNSHTTTFGYDTEGNLTSVTDPLSHTTSYGYDAYNNPTSITRPGLAPQTYTRNKLGDVLTSTTPLGHTTSYDYDANGGLIGITDPALNEWTVERDNMERPTAYVDPLLNRTEIDYDGNGKPVAVTDRRGFTTTYAYDLANQLTEIDAPATAPWTFDYDARGNRDSVIDPRANETSYEFDLADRLIAAHEPLGIDSSYDYDAAGNLTSLTDPNGHQTTFDYDDLGHMSAINQPLSKTTTYDYDPAGNLVERVTAEDTLAFAYDAADRLTSVSEGSNVLRAFGYDDADRLTSATDAQNKTIALGYDGDGNLTSYADDRGQTATRSFDSRGNLTGQVDGRGSIAYAYDELNRMTELTDPQSGVLDFAYDDDGNLTSTELPNGVTTESSYDGAGRMTSTSSDDSGSTVLQSFDYAYDDAGNRVAETDRNSDQTTYAYDALNRLVEFDPAGSAVVAYGYDDAGNRTSADGVTSTFNALNQLTSSSDGTTYDYDGAGRMIERTNGSQTTDYSWDPFDQLAEVDDGSSPVQFSYDALGRRSERTESAATATAHYGDLSDLATLDTDAGGVLQSFVDGPAGLAEQRSGSSTSYPLADAHGDVMTMADGSGSVASRQDWDPWGEPTTGPALEFGWLGSQERRTDPMTGLTQMGIRAYNPAMGRFLSEDPVLGHLEFGSSSNRLTYVGGNPITRHDVQGRDWCPNIFSPCRALEDPLYGQPVSGSGNGDVLNVADDVVGAFDAVGDALCPTPYEQCAPPAKLAVNGFQDFVQYVLPHVPCHEIGLAFDGLGAGAGLASIYMVASPVTAPFAAGVGLVGGGLDFAGVGLAALHHAGVC